MKILTKFDLQIKYFYLLIKPKTITKQLKKTILHDNITKTYQKAQSALLKMINMEAKNIAQSFNIDNKFDITAKHQCFVTKYNIMKTILE